MARNVYTPYIFNQNELILALFHNSATAPTGPKEGQFYYNSGTKQFLGWNGTAWVDLSQVVAASTVMRGEIANAASSPAYPAAPSIGDTYFITTQAGKVGTDSVEIGDQLVYSNSGWFVLQRNLQAATTALAGFARFATQAETNAGTDPALAISPAALSTFLVSFLYARKFRTLVTSLAANTPTTITHGLNLANIEDMHCLCYQGGQQIELTVTPTTANALTIASNQTLGNVTVVVQG